MRADRLVSILMLLQSRGQVPAPELARTLGVSVRTIYRDMDALSAAGIPVYAERGAAGGCRLVDDYRTDLTGLNPEEARALFLLTAPGPLDSLEVGSKLRSALRKLAAALPGYLGPAAGSRPRIHLDWSGWGRRQAAGEHLGLLYHSIQRQEKVRLIYRTWLEIEIDELAIPLGLVAKSGEWHLAWQGSHKRYWKRVSELSEVISTGQRFDYPADFDLEGAWREHLADWESSQTHFSVQVLAIPAVIGELHRRQGLVVLQQETVPDGAGSLRVELAFSSMVAACQNLMGLGRAVQVLEPPLLRVMMADYARQILSLYEGGSPERVT